MRLRQLACFVPKTIFCLHQQNHRIQIQLRPTPGNNAYIENPEIAADLLEALAKSGYQLRRPYYGVARGSLDPYFGGVHAIAFENGAWAGAADPRRDGAVGNGGKEEK